MHDRINAQTDLRDRVSNRCRHAGNWSWEFAIAGQRIAYAAVLEPHFQTAEGVVRAGANREVLTGVKLSGENLSFKLAITLEGIGFTRHEFSGKVRGERIEGTVRLALPEDARLDPPGTHRVRRPRNTSLPPELTCRDGIDGRKTRDCGFACSSLFSNV